MESADRFALLGIIIGLAGGALATALPLAFPGTPAWAWQLLFWIAALVLIGSGVLVAYDFLVRRRSLGVPKLDPLLWIALTAFTVGMLALGGFIAKTPKEVRVVKPVERAAPVSQSTTTKGVDRSKLSASEKERLSNVLFDVSAMLQRGEDLVNQSVQFAANSGRVLPAEQRLQLEKTLLDGSRILYEDLYNKYIPTHQYYNFDIFKIVLHDGALNAFRQSVNDYMVMIDHLADFDAQKTLVVLEGSPKKQLAIATNDLRAWATESLRRLNDMRRELQ